MDKLPPVSYLRMVDLWLISTQILPFIEVIILTFIESNTFENDTTNHHGYVRYDHEKYY